LAQDEFTYNDSMNRYTRKSPFKFFYGMSPKGVVYLVDLPYLGDRMSIDSIDFVDSMQELHEQVK
jgi:hypothetical protein